MAGGSLGLASSTASGLDLTNVRPQVTFFRKVFKRHTNFGIESMLQSNITGSANFGNTIVVTIDNNATLVTDMHMEFTLPPAAGLNGVDNANNPVAPRGSVDGVVSDFKEYASWVNGVGYAIIEEIELIIDGNTIDRHTGLWFDIWNELTDPNRKEWPLVGKKVDTDSNPDIVDTKTRYYVPLQFFFNRNPGLALPIFIIGENKVKIKITFNSLINLLNFNIKTTGDPTTIDTSASMSNFKFFTTFIYLEGVEREAAEREAAEREARQGPQKGVVFYEQYDARRFMNFKETFPRLAEFYDGIKIMDIDKDEEVQAPKTFGVKDSLYAKRIVTEDGEVKVVEMKMRGRNTGESDEWYDNPLDPESRAELMKKIGGSSIGWDTETDGLGGAQDE